MPRWLATPTRFAALSRRHSWLCLAAMVLLLLAALTALGVAGPPAATRVPEARGDEMADVVLYASIVEGLRQGDDYYRVTADALRSGNYPLRPFVTFRLPTLAVVQAWLPGWAVTGALYALVAAVVIAWHARLRTALSRTAPRIIAFALLCGGLAVFVQTDLVVFHEIWAGLLIALALAVRRADRWVEAVAIAMVAMLVRETAAGFVAVMAMIALVEGHRREALGWLASLAALALVITLHALAVDRVVDGLDPASPGWSGLLGFGFFVKTMMVSTALMLAPAWLGALLVGLAMLGWAGWDHPTGLRMAFTIALYATAIGLFARVDTFYWGLLVAPTLLLGLVFVPDGLRDLTARLLDRRRVRVVRGME